MHPARRVGGSDRLRMTPGCPRREGALLRLILRGMRQLALVILNPSQIPGIDPAVARLASEKMIKPRRRVACPRVHLSLRAYAYGMRDIRQPRRRIGILSGAGQASRAADEQPFGERPPHKQSFDSKYRHARRPHSAMGHRGDRRQVRRSRPPPDRPGD